MPGLGRPSTSCLPLSGKKDVDGRDRPGHDEKLRYGLMLFNSYPFIFLFLPIALIGYFVLVRLNHLAPVIWLALASLVFYSVSNWQFVLLLLASIAFNYVIGG